MPSLSSGPMPEGVSVRKNVTAGKRLEPLMRGPTKPCTQTRPTGRPVVGGASKHTIKHDRASPPRPGHATAVSAASHHGHQRNCFSAGSASSEQAYSRGGKAAPLPVDRPVRAASNRSPHVSSSIFDPRSAADGLHPGCPTTSVPLQNIRPSRMDFTSKHSESTNAITHHHHGTRRSSFGSPKQSSRALLDRTLSPPDSSAVGAATNKRIAIVRTVGGEPDDGAVSDQTLPLATHDMDEEYYRTPANWASPLPPLVLEIMEGQSLEPPFTTHLWKQAYQSPLEAESAYETCAAPIDPYAVIEKVATSTQRAAARQAAAATVDNPNVHLYHRRLVKGYYACARCQAPICSPSQQVINSVRGIAAFQRVHAAALSVQISTDIFQSVTKRDLQPEPSHRGGQGQRVTSELVFPARCRYCSACVGVVTMAIPMTMLDQVASGELFYANSLCLTYVEASTRAHVDDLVIRYKQDEVGGDTNEDEVSCCSLSLDELQPGAADSDIWGDEVA